MRNKKSVSAPPELFSLKKKPINKVINKRVNTIVLFEV